ncbi:MAG: nucleotide sugar dehydrogenase [Clostridia bacterium]
MKISILGLGYIGLPTAITLADAGFSVSGFDVSKDVVKTLNGGKIHIVENGLQEAFTRTFDGGKLSFTTTLEKSDVYYIAVPTPFYEDEDGNHKADLSFVKSAGELVAEILKEGDLVILESTVPPHTTKMLSDVLEKTSKISSDKFLVAHCPERVIPGNMLYELKNNDRIIGGRCQKASEKAKAIYDKVLEKGKCLITDDLTAEMCKLTENTYRDVNIAFANELSVICDKMDINVFELIKLANCHPRVNILTPGVGVGGHCIAVDPWFIYELFPSEAKLILASRERNSSKPRFVAEKIEKNIKKGETVGVLGLSYKPDVDDLRESPSIELCNILKDKGINFVACEPFVDYSLENITNLSFEECIKKADFLVITLGHTIFKENIEKIKEKPFYDCVGIM